MAFVLYSTPKANPPAVFNLNGVTSLQIGGPMRRETGESGPNNANSFASVNRVCNIRDRLFCAQGEHIYRFDGDAFFSNISGVSGSFVANETITGGTSGATATTLEAFISGDTYIIIKSISGTFQVSETITGGTSGATATLDSLPAQGGGTGQLGEWYVVHTYTAINTGGNFRGHSGIHSLNINGSQGLAVCYHDTANILRGVAYDADADTWTETGSSGISASTTDQDYGRSTIVGSSIFGFKNGNVSGGNTWSYNPSTSSFAQFISPQTGGVAAPERVINHTIIGWKGRIFGFGATTGQDLDLLELSGGTWTSVMRFNGAGVASTCNFRGQSTVQGVTAYIIRDKLFVLLPCSRATATGTYGYVLATLKIASNGDITCDNLDTSGPNIPLTEGEKFSVAYLPSAFDLVTAGITQNKGRWRVYRDQETNDPDGDDRIFLYHIADPLGGTTDVLRIDNNGAQDLTITLDWPGGTSTSQVINVTSGVPSSELSVDDLVALASDEQLFRVTNVNDAGPNITIDNPQGRTLPTGSTTSYKAVIPVSVGTTTGPTAGSLSDGNLGGGHRVFTKGELGAEITNNLPVVGGERISFKLYSSGGATVVKVELFVGSSNFGIADTKATLTNPSAGSLNGKTIETLTADNGATEYEVTWDAVTDGYTNGDNITMFIKVFV